jgi:hypothetical protein
MSRVSVAVAIANCDIAGIEKRVDPSLCHKGLEEFFVGVEFAVFASVVEGDVAVSPALALVDFAAVKGLGIDVDAYGALLEFGQIQDLVDGLERIDMYGVHGVHFVDFGGHDFAGAAGRIFFFNAEILNFQPADGSGHPAILIAMIVDTAVLADFPTNGHTLEEVVLENEIARVVASRKEAVLVEGLRADSVMNNVVLNVFEREVTLGDSGEAFDPVGDGELLDGELFWHGRKIIAPKRESEDVKKE